MIEVETMKKRIKYEISEIGEVIGGATPSTKDEDNYGGDIPWITPKDLSSFKERYIYRGERNISEKGLNSCSAKLMPKNTVLFSSRAPIGYVAIAANELCTNQGFKSIIADETKINFLYLYYYLIYKKGEIEAVASGTTFKEVSGSVLKKFNIEIPESILEQKAIAATLSCLDDIIELNNRTNKVLEEIAQAIFKRWFVDFEFPNEDGEPYKSSGGEMVDSELGEIPKGWRVVELGDVTTNIRERTKSNDYKVLSAVNTGDLKLSEEYFTKQVFSKDLSKYIIVRIKEFAYNPARVNIGSIGMNEYDFDGCVSPVYVVFKSEEDFHWFFKMFIKTKNFKSEVVKRASGSVRQSMNYSDFALIKIVYPPKGVIVKFNQFFETCYLAQREFTKEMEILSDIRDTLLPKLMSGEIRVPVEEVV